MKVKIKFAFPPHPVSSTGQALTLSPAFAEAATRRQAQGERELTFSSPPLTGGDIGEGEYANVYYSFTINRERDA